MGFGAILVVVMVLLAILLNMLNQLNRNMYQVVKEQYETVRLISVIRNETSVITVKVLSLNTNPPEEIKQLRIHELEEHRVNLKISLENLEKIEDGNKSLDAVEKLKVLNETFDNLVQQVVTLVDSGQKAEDNAGKRTPLAQIIWSDGGRVLNQMMQVIDELQETEERGMRDALNRSSGTYDLAIKVIYVNVLAVLLIGIGITFFVVRSITWKLNKVTSVINSAAFGTIDQLPRIELKSKDEIGDIALAFNKMAQSLEEYAIHEKGLTEAAMEQSWLKTKVAEITSIYPGVEDLQTLADSFITKITPIVGASYGLFYIKEEQRNQQGLSKLAAYAFNNQEIGLENILLGEGLVGQCALENKIILVSEVPDDYIKISSGIGKGSPASILILPVEFEGQVLAVIELASFNSFTTLQQHLLEQVLSNFGIAMQSIINHMQVENLLRESQALTEELQTQSEELQLQQEELRTINEKLEEQYENSEQKTRELERTQKVLKEKTGQLILGTKYKSEFMANMSHELRTPLNSLLILSQMLAENIEGNLTPKQVEYANAMYSSGNDLLNLINEILDLSKVESGKMGINPDEVILHNVIAFVEGQFNPVAQQKGIEFTTRIDANLPETIYTDEQRLQQILKNLLSNAFKFTDRGSVSLVIGRADKKIEQHGGKSAEMPLAFSVIDTGIGIPKENQSIIFEAFRQADGTTSRKYGGTGLGLTISREIAQLLGGFIDVDSVEGKGSIFTLYLLNFFGQTETKVQSSNMEVADIPRISENPLQGKKILVVDDDIRNVFALTTALESYQMKVVFAENGREGINVLRDNHPDVDLVLMDIMMPQMDGFEAIRAIRQIPEFQTLPVIALTAKAMKHDREQCIAAGASDYISKPVNLEQLFSLMRVWLYG